MPRLRQLFAKVAVILGFAFAPLLLAQTAVPERPDDMTIQGIVVGVDGRPASDATVSLQQKETSPGVKTKTDASGAFEFSSLASGNYRLTAEKSGSRSLPVTIGASDTKDSKIIKLALQEGLSTAQTMDFSDQPNFTVAGVTDWTAVGGHGSDSTLRTSESLASETATLKPEETAHQQASVQSDTEQDIALEHKLRGTLARTPDNFAANHQLGELYLRTGRYAAAIPVLELAYRSDPADLQNQIDIVSAYEGAGDLAQARINVHRFLAKQQSAELNRLAGELDDKSGDSLAAVHEYELAVNLNPSEQNYFEWGSELLLHRAVWQAQQVFRKGVDAYPRSVRMQTALGTALFAGARYDEAALHLCSASEMNPADPNPYIFMGKIQTAAPNPLPCVEPKLARFVQQQPNSSIANYLYAMSILKRQEQAPDKQAERQAATLLTKAITLDAKCSDAYLELGILSVSHGSFDQAIDFYKKAIEADPHQADAYYRLGVAYDRLGQTDKAKQEFQLHDQVKEQQDAAIDKQRREVKQFMVVQQGSAGAAAQ